MLSAGYKTPYLSVQISSVSKIVFLSSHLHAGGRHFRSVTPPKRQVAVAEVLAESRK